MRTLATTYGYDDDGNLTSSLAGLALAYNEKNQTTSVTPPGGAALTMAYRDATQDRRIQAGDQRIAYNQLGLTGQGPNNGNPHDAYWVRDDEGTLISQKLPSGARHYFLFDGLGSVVGLTNFAGTLVASYEYEPYGKQTSAEPSVSNPWRFASGYYDKSTGFLKFGTRYYMPTLARWTQRDPSVGRLSNPMSLAPYSYVGCDPVNAADPSGRSFMDFMGRIGCTLWDVLNPNPFTGSVGSALVGSGAYFGSLGGAIIAGTVGSTLGLGIGVGFVLAGSVMLGAGFYSAWKSCG